MGRNSSFKSTGSGETPAGVQVTDSVRHTLENGIQVKGVGWTPVFTEVTALREIPAHEVNIFIDTNSRI